MDRSTRKLDHIRHALETTDQPFNSFDEVSFVPNSLPNIGYHDVSLATDLGSFRLVSPIIINAMTGGAEATTEINRKLAIIAREKHLAMAVGSQMAALRDPGVADSYRIVRKEHPNGIVFANVGAEATVEQAQAAVDMLDADGLQIHLNVMQELLMPEGDRDFRGYIENIQVMKESLDVPVMVKEVGFGMAKETIEKLNHIGISIIDVGGVGGTNFAKVENRRSQKPLAIYENWGLTTVQSLLEAESFSQSKSQANVAIMATGGVRHGLDVLKALVLGASATGIAGEMLRLVQTSSLEDCLTAVDEWHHQLKVGMTALGVTRIADCPRIPVFVYGKAAYQARLRGIDLEILAQRVFDRATDS
ncbi:type 2 isopentenyl-diphosphate Delta-isomerase [Brevibacillus reuszeri]|uniref:type 2 isopentenyl-diphosphate Delta-isomerase n=1 Tax=Brevibacillus reuszeri TaxID=54915 RepID=UPI0028A10D6E|nr:type 2 isopentenyl-diphosphate Delta-isomerase [Brevibacillus reuszeri]